MLYVIPAPVGVVTVIVPVDVTQLGCVTLATGVARKSLTVRLRIAVESQPTALVVV
jgi:hypothetical protein